MTMTQESNRDAAENLLNDFYPCTALLLGDRIDAVITEFCREPPAAGVDFASDAQSRLSCLLAEIPREAGLAKYLADVLAYEGAVACLATSEEARRDARLAAEDNLAPRVLDVAAHRNLVPIVGRNIRVERYAFNAPSIVAAIENCDRLEGLEDPDPRTVLLVLSINEPRARPFLISEGVAMILASCDGSRDCAAVARSVRAKASNGGDEEFELQALGAIETLAAKNALRYCETGDSALRAL